MRGLDRPTCVHKEFVAEDPMTGFRKLFASGEDVEVTGVLRFCVVTELLKACSIGLLWLGHTLLGRDGFETNQGLNVTPIGLEPPN